MKQKNLIFLVLAGLILPTIFYFSYNKFFCKPSKYPYKIRKAEKRTISKIIDTCGRISVAEKIKIGSLVVGTIKKIHVEENSLVKKGQLLAEIETGKSDTDVRESQGNLQKYNARFVYFERYYERQKELYSANQISQDSFEQVTRDYVEAKSDLQSYQARYDRAKEEYDNTKVYSPQDGMIIKVGISEGERVVVDLNASVLFEIAKDITKMEADLEIDEIDIGSIKKGLDVSLTIDSFPSRLFRTNITDLSYSPKEKGGNTYYKAISPVDNSDLILRPGLSVNAKVFIAKVNNALTLSSQAFMINSKILEELAKKLNYGFEKLSKDDSSKDKCDSKIVRSVWILKRDDDKNKFVESKVVTGITDDIYFEILEGLSESDEVIVDLEESNYMEEVYKKAFGSKF